MAAAEDGVKKLNELSKTLLPKVEAFEMKMSKMAPSERAEFSSNVTLADIKPMIQFRMIQMVLGQLAGGGAHGHTHGGKPCGGHGHSH